MKLPNYAFAVMLLLMFLGAIFAYVYQIRLGNNTGSVIYLVSLGPLLIAWGITPLQVSKWWNAASIFFGIMAYFLYFFGHLFGFWWEITYLLIALVFGLILDSKNGMNPFKFLKRKSAT